jgi:hypothetical protein
VIDEEVFSVHDEANSGPSSPEISKKTVSATKAFGKDAAKDFVKGTSSSLFASKKAADKDVVESNMRPTSVNSNDFTVHIEAKAD